MPCKNDETRRGWHAGRASESVVGCDGSGDSADRLDGQAQGLKPDAAGESPFDHGEPRVIDVFNGGDLLGRVAIGRSIRAIRPDGIELGRFATEEEARRAVVRAAFGGGAR